MHAFAVGKALRFYKANRWGEVRTLDDLEAVLARFRNHKEGNGELAQFLWGNNYWNRADWLRGHVRWLRDSNWPITTRFEPGHRTAISGGLRGGR